ncbi:hypothetical protein GA0111570_109128 [Raineyella antarctica]|uniref:DUF2029 domain-containing protein n=1 Tax=Raineyella antarctica TaxID=1577474 RepID=A0A1G6HG93_9ACTN|nr:hypothetical protein [Raineyella antarctica]SDB93260.1 hypothetical protein GA0111570_109128 [Raineyella antarctica]
MSLQLDPSQALIRRPGADPAQSRPRLVGDRRRATLWSVLVGWLILWAVVSAYHGLYSWHYFRTGGSALLDPSSHGGLHVFAAHPELQMGPLTLLVSALVVAVVGSAGSGWVGAALMLMLGLLDLWFLWQAGAAHAERTDRPDRTVVGPRAHDGPPGRVVALAGAFMLPVWSVVAVHYGHLDDVLAMSLVCAGLLQATRGRSWSALVLLALATAAKPWALPMMLIAWGGREGRLRRAVVGIVAVALPWLVFVIADPRTLSVGSFTIHTEVDSVLRVLGATDPTTPPWDRPAQLLLGVLIAWLCARYGRIGWIPLAVMATRLVLDPGTYLYYTSSLALAAVAADLVGRRGARVPWLTIAVTAWFVVDLVLKLQLRFALAGLYRSAFLLTLLGIVAATPVRLALRARSEPGPTA